MAIPARIAEFWNAFARSVGGVDEARFHEAFHINGSQAESDGFAFLSTIRISEGSGGIALTSYHDAQPQGIVARLLSIPMGLRFKGAAKKAFRQDLDDIKSAVERK